MAFTETELGRIEKSVGALCRGRSPAHLKKELRVEYRISGHDVLIFEVRPRWDKPEELSESDIAKLRYMRTRKRWYLLWKRASGKWETYQPRPENKDISVLVSEIENDPYGCFWG
jgi:hypothetical protein